MRRLKLSYINPDSWTFRAENGTWRVDCNQILLNMRQTKKSLFVQTQAPGLSKFNLAIWRIVFDFQSTNPTRWNSGGNVLLQTTSSLLLVHSNGASVESSGVRNVMNATCIPPAVLAYQIDIRLFLGRQRSSEDSGGDGLSQAVSEEYMVFWCPSPGPQRRSQIRSHWGKPISQFESLGTSTSSVRLLDLKASFVLIIRLLTFVSKHSGAFGVRMNLWVGYCTCCTVM